MTYTPGGGGVSLGETDTTAYRGDRGKTAYDHTALTNNPHAVTKAQVGLANADNTSDAGKPVSSATQTALDGKQPLATVLTNTTAAFTAAQESKLSGIATGATANATDAALRDRSTHTGSQDFTTISGLPSTLAGHGISDAAPLSHVGAGGTAHANAVAGGAAGFLTGTDKTKLDNLSGTNTGDQTSVSGNAGTATTLQTARNFSVSGDATASAVSFNGSAAVDLAVTNTQARGLRETGGPTTLTMGAVADGEYLRRSGTSITGGSPGGGSGLTHPQVLARVSLGI